jgi:hypothetical protein
MFHKRRRPGVDSTIWALRRDGLTYVRAIHRPHGNVDDIAIVRVHPLPPGEEFGGYTETLQMSRKDARLLAKRINQCLDATRLS